MSRSGWGWLLGLSFPALMFFAWSQLGSQQSRIHFERFAAWQAKLTTHPSNPLLYPLERHFTQHGTLARQGDLELPPVPKDIGVRSWSLQPDSTVKVVLDGKAGGRAVVLMYVPVYMGGAGVRYECVSATAAPVVGDFCHAHVLQTIEDLPARLAANDKALATRPAVVSASGVELQPGTAAGSVVAMPSSPGGLRDCGYQCVKPQSCITPRPLACSQALRSGNTTGKLTAPTQVAFRGNSFATRAQADLACQDAFGPAYRVLDGSSMWGTIELTPGHEYWVHDDLRDANCWPTDR